MDRLGSITPCCNEQQVPVFMYSRIYTDRGERGPSCLELTKISDYMDDDELEHAITYISVLTVCYIQQYWTHVKGHKRTYMENG